MFSEIRTAIIDKISNDLTKIQIAYRTDRSDFEGFPCAVVSPSENQADWNETKNDAVSYVFKVRLYYPIEGESNQDGAEIALEEALEEFLTVFNKRDVLGSACDWVEPVPSVWQYEERASGTYRMAEITLKCRKHISNS